MNVDRPNGLLPRRHGTGGTPGRLTAYAIDDQHPNDIFSGDPVKTTGSASLLNGRAFIDVVGASDVAVGVFAGVRYVDSNGEQQFRPRWIGGTVVQEDPRSPIEALVYDDPDMRFLIQVSGAAGLAAVDVGQEADYLVGAGNSFTGRSAFELDQSTLGGVGTMKILGLAGPVVNNDFGEFADALVLINQHENRSTVTII
jgi:hypothetical protein